MQNLLDFSPHGYQAIEELGYNQSSHQTIYQAKCLKTQQLVVIKHIDFPKRADQFKAWEKGVNNELNALINLNHPTIPHVQESFEMADKSRCIVLDCMPGQSLAVRRSFTPDQIKTIAVSLLETLVYLQEEQIPFVLHRDIKPANVMVDETSDPISVSLIDFGIARIGSKELGLTTMVAGTQGFMAPEQRCNKTLTKAADLFGLGATLICLITGIEQDNIDDELTDYQNRITFKHLASGFSFRFIEWLEKMVAPDPDNRFPDAKTALKQLQPLYVKRLTEPQFNIQSQSLNMTASYVGEKVAQTISVANSVPETVLQGTWEVQYHPQHDITDWLRVEPSSFQSNNCTFKIIADTSKLIAQHTFNRTLTLHTPNASKPAHTFQVKITTAELPVPREPIPYKWIATQIAITALAGVAITITPIGTVIKAVTMSEAIIGGVIYGVWLGVLFGAILCIASKESTVHGIIGIIIIITVGGAIAGAVAVVAIESGFWAAVLALIISGGWVAILCGIAYSNHRLLNAHGSSAESPQHRDNTALALLSCIVGFGTGFLLLGYAAKLGMAQRVCVLEPVIQKDSNTYLWLCAPDEGHTFISRIFSTLPALPDWLISWWVLLPTVVSGLLLVAMLAIPSLRRYLKVTAYRKKEQHLIKA